MIKFILLILFCFLNSSAFAVTTPFVIDVDTANESILHPDCHYFRNGLDGYKYWMVATPYPGNAQERPWFFRSNDGDTWVQTGFSNPVFDPVSTLGWTFYADPDWLYIPEYGRFFMVGGPCMSGTSPNTECGIDLWTSTNGTTWTAYTGTAVNGNTNPVFLSGTSAGGKYTIDSGAVAWEKQTANNIGKTQYPTMIFKNGIFHLWYGETSGNSDNTEDGGLTNNVGKVGYATFTWNSSTGNIENFTRYAGNPVLSLAKDNNYYSGIGHIDVSIMPNGQYEMIGLRNRLADGNPILVKLTSVDGINWTYQGTLQDVGASGTWNDTALYRSSVCTDGYGNQVMLNGRRQILLTGSPDYPNEYHIGWYDDTNFVNFENTIRSIINNSVINNISYP